MKEILLGCLVCLTLICCNSSRKGDLENQVAIPQHPWFKTEKISESLWRISDHGEDNLYLIAGRDSAMLVDTGIGPVNLVDYVKKITRLPLIVINTHGHPDHVGSNNQFETIYAHPEEFQRIKLFTGKEMHQNMLQYMVQIPIPDSLKYSPRDSAAEARLIPVANGQVFDLGEREIEVIYAPGHTSGSICLLDRKQKLLFTGDNVKKLVWMHMAESSTLEVYLQSLQTIKTRLSEFTLLLPGHDDPLDSNFIGEEIICVQNILEGKCESIFYKSVVGNGQICEYNTAQVAFLPDKLR